MPLRRLWSQANCALVTVSLRARTQQTFKINPNTAHKVVTHLVAEGVLEVHSGTGTVVAKRACSTAADRSKLLHKELEQLIVEAKRLGLTFDDVTSAAAQHWKCLDGSKK